MPFLMRDCFEPRNVNAKRKYGMVAPMLACQKGHKHDGCVDLPIKLEMTDVNEKRNDGITALMLACENSLYQCVHLLYKSEMTDADEKRNSGMKALMLAWTCVHGNSQTTQSIIQAANRNDMSKEDTVPSVPFLTNYVSSYKSQTVFGIFKEDTGSSGHKETDFSETVFCCLMSSHGISIEDTAPSFFFSSSDWILPLECCLLFCYIHEKRTIIFIIIPEHCMRNLLRSQVDISVYTSHSRIKLLDGSFGCCLGVLVQNEKIDVNNQFDASEGERLLLENGRGRINLKSLLIWWWCMYQNIDTVFQVDDCREYHWEEKPKFRCILNVRSEKEDDVCRSSFKTQQRFAIVAPQSDEIDRTGGHVSQEEESECAEMELSKRLQADSFRSHESEQTYCDKFDDKSLIQDKPCLDNFMLLPLNGFDNTELFKRFPFFHPELANIDVFPVLNARQRTDFKQVVCYEMVRLCTFNLCENPAHYGSWITELAAAGFYNSGAQGEVACFSCSRWYNNYLSGIPLLNAHEPRCRWREANQPLSCGIDGIEYAVLMNFIKTIETSDVWKGRSRSQNVSSASIDSRGTSLTSPIPDSGNRGTSLTSPIPDSGNRGTPLSSAVPDSGNRGTPFSSAVPDSVNRGTSLTPPTSDSGYYSASSKSTHDGASNRQHNLHLACPDGVSKSRSDQDQRPSSRERGAGESNRSSLSKISQEASFDSGRKILTSATNMPLELQSGQASGFQMGRIGEDLPDDETDSSAQNWDLSGASYPQFASREARRESYRFWDPDHIQKPNDLVDLGFFYSGYSDCARCFYCGLGLKYWRPNDDPAYQHARFRPQCLYNKLLKGQAFIDKVQYEISQGANPSGNASREDTNHPLRRQHKISTMTNECSIHHDLPQNKISARYLQAKTRFDKSSAVIQAKEEGWIQEDLEEAYKKLQASNSDAGDPRYATLISILQDLQKEKQNRAVPDSAGNGTDRVDSVRDAGAAAHDGPQLPPVQPLDDPERIRLAEMEHTRLKDRMHCMFCKVSRIGCVFLPCGHVVACQDCGDKATVCILCGKHIAALANIYLS